MVGGILLPPTGIDSINQAMTPINRPTVISPGISSTGGPDDGEWKSLNATKVVS